VIHRIKTERLKWTSVSSFFTRSYGTYESEGKIYKATIILAMLYGLKCWAIKK